MKRGCLVLAAIFGIASAGFAEEPIATELDVATVPDYLGTWILTLDLMGNEMELFLTISDVDGKVGATLDSERSPEPLAISEIKLQEDGDGLAMASELKFGDFAISVAIDAQLEAGQLNGTIKESSSELFKSDFVGTKHTGDADLVQGKRPSPTEARFRLPEGKLVRVTFGNITTEHADFAGIEKLGAGEVFSYTSSRATKMYTDKDIKFGETIVKAENAAPNYPGVYSLWLKKTETGWGLVFNSEADTWGTRHNPATDVAEVPLTLSEAAENQEEFIVKIDEQADGSALLKLAWGTHEWSAPFAMVQ